MTRPLPRHRLALALLGAGLLTGAASMGVAVAQPTTTEPPSSTTPTTEPTTTTTDAPTTTSTSVTTTTSRPSSTTTTARPRPSSTTTTVVRSSTTSSSSTTTEAPAPAPTTIAPAQVPGLPTTTTTRAPGQPAASGLSSSAKLRLVIAGLVLVALAFVVLTVLYWRHTSPASPGDDGTDETDDSDATDGEDVTSPARVDGDRSPPAPDTTGGAGQPVAAGVGVRLITRDELESLSRPTGGDPVPSEPPATSTGELLAVEPEQLFAGVGSDTGEVPLPPGFDARGLFGDDAGPAAP